MNQVIHSFNSDSLTMSSREISDLTGKRHDHVIRDIRAMFDQLELSPNFGEKVEATGGRPSSVYHLDRDLTDCLLTGYSAKARMKVIKRWRELEGREPALPDFTNPAIAARAWADEVEQKQVALVQLEAAKPAVEFSRQVEAAHGAISVAETAKIIGTGQNRLFSFLRQTGWVTRRNEPYQVKIELGYLDVKIQRYEHPDKGLKETITTLVTGKGLRKLQALWASQQTLELH